jgi:hypothetical protein
MEWSCWSSSFWLDDLTAVQKRGVGLLPKSPNTLGANSSADLVFTPINPCRVINTASREDRSLPERSGNNSCYCNVSFTANRPHRISGRPRATGPTGRFHLG